MTSSRCSKCKEVKPVYQFSRDSRKKNGRRYVCKVCESALQKARREADPDRFKAYQIKRKYHLSPEGYAAFLASECEVCGRFEDLCIDHDRSCCPGVQTCGRCLRGTLCRRCNSVEGLLESNPDLALALASYMVRYEDVVK